MKIVGYFPERLPVLLKTLILITLFIGMSSLLVFSEDEIHYGADSYSIDYDSEIIYANGHVYFIRGNRKVTSVKARIYYSENKQVALFFKDVVFIDSDEKVVIKGKAGTAYYEKDIYIIKGNAEFQDNKRKILAEKIEYHSGVYSNFKGGVRFIDDQYEITGNSLMIEEDQAEFSGEITVIVKKNSDRIYCKKLTYNPDNGNVSFTGGTLYIPGKEGNPVISASAIMYIEGEKSYNFIDNVYIKGEDYIIRAPLVVYNENEESFYGLGGVFTVMNEKYIEADRMKYSLRNSRALFSGNVSGVIKTKKKE